MSLKLSVMFLFVFITSQYDFISKQKQNKTQDYDFKKSAGNTGINLPHIMESDWLIAGNSHIGRE